jgi:pyochelin synthetase
MSTQEIIADLQKLGVRLWEESGQLRFRAAKGIMTDERRELLKVNKEQLLASLRAPVLRAVVADPAALHRPFPLTDVQSAYLLGRGSAFGLGGVACHLYLELDFADLVPLRVEKAWNALIARHDMLRAVFAADGSQNVLAEVPHYCVASRDLRESSKSELDAELDVIRAELGHRIHQADRWPLFELRTTLGLGLSRLHLSIDFLIADWTSIQLLIAQFNEIYRGRSRSEVPKLGLSFRDYVLAERGLHETPRFALDRDYWLGRVDDLPPAPALPTLALVPDVPARFGRRSVELSPLEWRALQDAAAIRNITPSAAVLAAFAETLGNWSRSSKFTINLTLLNRLPLHSDVEHLVGDFTSINLLAVDTSAGERFEQRAATLALRLFEDLDHRLYSGINVLRELARRRGQGAAALPVVFTSAIGSEARSRMGADDAPKIGYGITQTPQVWIDCQAMDHRGSLHVNWDFREGVFAPELLDEMFTAFRGLLQRLAVDDDAWRSAAPIALSEEQRLRREQVNATAAPFHPELLHAGFLRQARATPDRVAVLSANESLTYGELERRARSLQQLLRGRGCRAGDRVAVVLDKGWEQVVSVLAISFMGAAYVPIDTFQPSARRDKLLADARVGVVVVHPSLAATWESSVDVRLLSLNESAPILPEEPVETAVTDPAALAYVIYTSGSTGQPKGVMVSHRSALNTVLDINRRFAIAADDRVLGLANLGFDLSVYDIFGPLLVGACLVLPPTASANHACTLVF